MNNIELKKELELAHNLNDFLMNEIEAKDEQIATLIHALGVASRRLEELEGVVEGIMVCGDDCDCENCCPDIPEGQECGVCARPYDLRDVCEGCVGCDLDSPNCIMDDCDCDDDCDCCCNCHNLSDEFIEEFNKHFLAALEENPDMTEFEWGGVRIERREEITE